MNAELKPHTEVTPVILAGKKFFLFDLPKFFAEVGIEAGSIPFVRRILIEASLRARDPNTALLLATGSTTREGAKLEMPFHPARIIVQDYTGIPLLVDLAALRNQVEEAGGAPEVINPVITTEVVVDHSIQVDVAGSHDALVRNEQLELERNHERYTFLKWAEQAFTNLRVIPPGDGIVHQINLERLAKVVTSRFEEGKEVVFPDSVLGTDSHTTMINGLGILGWGVGGLEAEAVMLGLALPIAIPKIVGVRLLGKLRPGVTATDAVLALTAHLRMNDLAGAAVEFTGSGVATLSAADRCTLANMAPEYGAMAGFFPVDAETLQYLRQTGRDEEHIRLVEAYCDYQGLLREPTDPEPHFDRLIEFDLAGVQVT